MSSALRGRWRMSGDSRLSQVPLQDKRSRIPGVYIREGLSPAAVTFPEEEEGSVHVETQGVAPRYLWIMHFSLGSAGRKSGTRNNRLSWKGFWSYNKLTDDYGEFGLKNDKPYYFSRVKSYGSGS